MFFRKICVLVSRSGSILILTGGYSEKEFILQHRCYPYCSGLLSAEENPFLGRWTLTPASGGARWASLKDVNKPGSSLEGWAPVNKNVANGWFAKDGILINDPVQQEGQPHVAYGNLVTDGAWEDFNLTLKVTVPKDGNSGIYLRGIYEVQVVDSFGKATDCHGMGAIYGRITPRAAAKKPAGQWQPLDITPLDRHITVKLNGTTIIDNQPLAGCTGGALWSDESLPGPVHLQGDHTGVQYKNILIRPVFR